MPNPLTMAQAAGATLLGPSDGIVAAARLTSHDGAAPRGRGGPVGWIVARAMARHETRWAHAREVSRPPARYESLPGRQIDLGRAGGLAAVTKQRLLVWQLVDRHRTRELVYDEPRDEVVVVHDRYVTRWALLPRARTRAISVIYNDDTVLRMWAVEPLRRRRDVDGFLAAVGNVD